MRRRDLNRDLSAECLKHRAMRYSDVRLPHSLLLKRYAVDKSNWGRGLPQPGSVRSTLLNQFYAVATPVENRWNEMENWDTSFHFIRSCRIHTKGIICHTFHVCELWIGKIVPVTLINGNVTQNVHHFLLITVSLLRIIYLPFRLRKRVYDTIMRVFYFFIGSLRSLYSKLEVNSESLLCMKMSMFCTVLVVCNEYPIIYNLFIDSIITHPYLYVNCLLITIPLAVKKCCRSW